jgi:hypothetical protein
MVRMAIMTTPAAAGPRVYESALPTRASAGSGTYWKIDHLGGKYERTHNPE